MGVKVASQPRASKVSLPVEKSKPSDLIGDYTWLLYGAMKIGKTSLAAQFPDALFAMFEPGGSGLEIYQVQITTWGDYKELLRLLKAAQNEDGEMPYKTVVIDTVDVAYDKCMTWVGERHGFEHPGGMNDYGKSWKLVSKEFADTITATVNLGLGLVFISHAKESEFTRESTGETFNKVVPSMTNQARNFIQSFVDVIAYYGYHGDERRLVIRGSDKVDAGHRMHGRFVIKDAEGEVLEHIYTIPMGASPEEGFANIQRAFLNQQEDALPLNQDAEQTGSRVKKKTKE